VRQRGARLAQVQTQTFSDVFMVILVAFSISTAMAPLMTKVEAPKAPSADAH